MFNKSILVHATEQDPAIIFHSGRLDKPSSTTALVRGCGVGGCVVEDRIQSGFGEMVGVGLGEASQSWYCPLVMQT